jgi:HlyD family secretion protein
MSTRSVHRPGRVWFWFLLTVVMAVAAGFGTGLISVRSESAAQMVAPVDRPLQHVGAWGRLSPRGEVRSLAAPSAMDAVRVAQLNVVEGQRVAAGEVIAILDTHEQRRVAVRHAQAMLALAEAKLHQARDPAKPSDIIAQEALIARRERELAQAAIDLDREETLRQRQANTQTAVEEARLKRQQVQLDVQQSKAQLESLRTPRAADVLVAERQVDEAKTALEQAEADLALTEIRSPSASTILRIHARAGERVGDNGVVQIGDVDQMYAVAEVYEADLARIKIGQPARVRIPTLKQETSGKVERLGFVVQRKDVFNTDPVADTDARVVEVWIRLADDAPQAVKQLSNARVEVIIDVSEGP